MADTDIALAQLAARLRALHWRIAVAESCTGGRLAAALTRHAGSSDFFDCGLVTYSYASKTALLGVDASRLEREGAVCAWTVESMCAGLLTRTEADLVVATSGIAGPDGGSADKPVGTVCFGWALRDAAVRSACRHFGGDRQSVMAAAVACALEGALVYLDELST